MALHRTPLTWAMYGANGAWASFVYLSGPVAPVIAESLGVPLSVAGLVGTALAAGLASASVAAPAAIRAFDRDRAAVVALVVLAAGLIVMMVLPTLIGGVAGYVILLVLVWILATAGGTTMNTTTARLAQVHPEHSAAVITEANAAAGWVGLLSPLLLGLALGAGLGWRAGIAFCLLAAVAAILGLLLAGRAMARRGPLPGDGPLPLAVAESVMEMSPEAAAATSDLVAEADRSGGTDTQPPPGGPATASGGSDTTRGAAHLPRAFWFAMLALFAAAASEFAVNFWGSTLIQDQTGAAAAAATAAMSASVAGIAIGRTIGSALTARLGPHRMLLGGFVLALAGFAVLWASTMLALSVAGLFLVGLGLATLFPLILDRSIALSGGRPDLAMSRVALILGLAIGGAPFVLGALGAVMPVQAAMLLVPVFVVAGILGVLRSRPMGA